MGGALTFQDNKKLRNYSAEDGVYRESVKKFWSPLRVVRGLYRGQELVFSLILLMKGRMMNISNKSRVALDSLVILQKKQNKGAISLVSIAQELNVSVSYLELIFRTLREAGLVAALRGPGGGYRLNTPADQITPQAVCLLFEAESEESASEAGASPESAPVHALAHRMKAVKQHFLSQMTLKNLAGQGAMG